MSTIRVNPAACDGFGFCSEILPEMIRRDECGFPILADDAVPEDLRQAAEQAVAFCPAGLCAWRRPGPGEQGQARRAVEVVR
jgi:ferredoxin